MRNEINTDLESVFGLSERTPKIRVRSDLHFYSRNRQKDGGVADGVIVGSAIVKLLEKYGENGASIHWKLYKRNEKMQ